MALNGYCQPRMLTITRSLIGGHGKVMNLLIEAETVLGFSVGVRVQTELVR